METKRILTTDETILIDIPVHVYEIISDHTTLELFGTHLARQSLNEYQIKTFCKKHSLWLQPFGCATFFLLKKEGVYSIVAVHKYSNEIEEKHYPLDSEIVWGKKFHHRIVARV